MAALSASESPMLPKHLYENGGEPPANPLVSAPIGTGPFKFIEWQRGRYLRLERNPDYWVQGKPQIDEMIALIRVCLDATLKDLQTRGWM